jgi:hypothetical protein
MGLCKRIEAALLLGSCAVQPDLRCSRALDASHPSNPNPMLLPGTYAYKTELFALSFILF